MGKVKAKNERPDEQNYRSAPNTVGLVVRMGPVTTHELSCTLCLWTCDICLFVLKACYFRTMGFNVSNLFERFRLFTDTCES